MDPPKKNTRHPVFFSKKHHHLFLFHHFHMRFPVQISPKKSHPFRFLRTWGIWKPLILPCAAPRVGEKNTDWWYKLDSHGHESLGNVTECGNMNHGQTMDYLYPWTFVRNLETWHAIWKLQVFFGVISYSEKLKSGFLGKWTGSKLSCWTSSQKDSTFLHCLIVSISFKVFWFSTMETGWWSYMINDEHKHLQTRFFFSRFERFQLPSLTYVDLGTQGQGRGDRWKEPRKPPAAVDDRQRARWRRLGVAKRLLCHLCLYWTWDNVGQRPSHWVASGFMVSSCLTLWWLT